MPDPPDLPIPPGLSLGGYAHLPKSRSLSMGTEWMDEVIHALALCSVIKVSRGRSMFSGLMRRGVHPDSGHAFSQLRVSLGNRGLTTSGLTQRNFLARKRDDDLALG